MESKESQNTMYNNCQTYGEELEDVFSESEILYLIEYRNNTSNDNYNQPKNYVEIINIIQKLVKEYKETETVNKNDLKEICLDLWFYCMGWTQLQYKNKTNNLLQLIDTNCNELFNYMSSSSNINVLMMLLKICLTEHKKSIDSLLEESQGVITFNQIHAKQTDNKNIISFWNTFSILNICMNSILCISWSQRNSPNIMNNPLFIDTFHIDKEPLFVHLFNYISQDNYCERMPIKKFIIYIRWHIFFTNNTANKLNQIRNTFKTNKLKKKCAVTDFFEIADKIDCNYTPLLILPPSINTNNNKEAFGLNRLSTASSMLKKSISELFGKDDDEKYNKNAKIKYERPNGLDYKYPIYEMNIRRFKFETGNPRIELFGKDIVPTDMTSLLQNCFEHLSNGTGKKDNMYACDIYKYIAIKSQIPDWILMEQNHKNNQFNKKDSSPKWLQNIRMSLGIKMLIKLMCSTMPSSYCRTANKITMRVTNVPDIRYEIIASIFNEKEELNYFMDLKRHQNILIFNILMLLLALLKLFRTHEILQFEYLKYLIQKNNGIIVLCKLFAHPWTVIQAEKTLFLTKADTYIDIQYKQQLFDMLYNDERCESESDGKSSSKIVTIKINALRIMQKCVKYSFGHCNLLCNILSYDKWLVKYMNNTNDNDDNEIERYYILKLFKSMMSFINKKEEYKDIIELIKNNIRIGINDQWLSEEIKQEFDDVIAKYREKQEKPQNLKIDPYYQWLALKKPTERDYAETRFNPFAIKNNYGIPNLAQIAPQKWTELIDDECTSYHEWLIQQIECDNREFLKQKKYIGFTRKEMEKQKMIERSTKVDKGLAKIQIPHDFDFTRYLKAYFSGNADKMLDKI